MENNSRIKRAAKRALDSEQLNIVYLGGAVTVGYVPEKGIVKDNYVQLSFDHFCRKTGNYECLLNNMGFSGEDPFMGLSLTDRYYNKEDPDIVFLEYALNSSDDDEESCLAFEGLVRKYYDTKKKTAIVVLILPDMNKETPSYIKEIAEYYELCVIDIASDLNEKIKKKVMKKSDVFLESGYPSLDGHRYFANCIAAFYSRVWREKLMKESPAPQMPLFSDIYKDFRFIGFNWIRDISIQGFDFTEKNELFPKMLSSNGSDMSVVSFTVRFSSLFLIYEESANINCGDLQVYVDNSYTDNISGYQPGSWENPKIKMICRNDNEAFHDVKIVMKNGDRKRFINLLGIGII